MPPLFRFPPRVHEPPVGVPVPLAAGDARGRLQGTRISSAISLFRGNASYDSASLRSAGTRALPTGIGSAEALRSSDAACERVVPHKRHTIAVHPDPPLRAEPEITQSGTSSDEPRRCRASEAQAEYPYAWPVRVPDRRRVHYRRYGPSMRSRSASGRTGCGVRENDSHGLKTVARAQRAHDP